ncbi:phosphoribosylglycinamide formyltransferase [Deinococcus radiophilus]|uniref:phosphoribosylglycinamide formyltransferase n=1 Tax=Deinococcus radiophilus TaxID=32062 RepID=UPI001E28F11D|nr:phosphoribosylglycinamide formyltransferase [Deinococcus radiophilus]UFA51239.1 phosphoribosylglycinamide formyltransferase [Deinococcus radiophilus]
MARLGFLASHGGSGARAIAQACARGDLAAQPAALISNNGSSSALAWAREEGLPAAHLSGTTHPDPDALDTAILGFLRQHSVDIVILSGYMKVLEPKVLAVYAGRILNIHPSLLPKFGGQGMYGDRVHQAVIDAGELESGATVHLVTAGLDEGPVLAQSNVPVLLTDTLEGLRNRVQATEGKLYVKALRRFLDEWERPGS